MDFDTDGEWDEKDQIGPAIHAPLDVKAIVVNQYRVEWLNLSDPKDKYYAKNHMVATLRFAKPEYIGDKRYSSARISVELGPEKVVEIYGQEVRSTHIPIPN